MKPALHVVAKQPKAPPPDLSYEARERRHIMARNWNAVHIAADRRAPISLADRIKRAWVR